MTTQLLSQQPALTAGDTLRWLDDTSSRWQQFLTAHADLLTLSCDIAGVHTVAELLQHIVAVELRYAERLTCTTPTDYAELPFDTVDALFNTHQRAAALFQQALASTVDWDEHIEFTTRSMGPARAPRKAVLFHAMFHAIRHYAQLATLVRQHGVKPDWPMDYLFLDVERLPQNG